MVAEGKGIMLDQFANPDNPLAHYEDDRAGDLARHRGKITHFVSSMGTTGTIMGCSRFFKEKNPKIEIVGCQPEEGSQIPGIRKWPEAYLPKIYDGSRVDRLEYVGQADAEDMTRRMAKEEGLFAGISSGGAMAVALRVAEQVRERGDRHHRLRSRRPLSVYRVYSRPDGAAPRASWPFCFARAGVRPAGRSCCRC
jgi:cysteine synthase B